MNNTSASERFQKGIELALMGYYKQAISDNIKRGLAKKKMSTSAKLPCKAE